MIHLVLVAGLEDFPIFLRIARGIYPAAYRNAFFVLGNSTFRVQDESSNM